LIGLDHWNDLLKACLQGVCVNACASHSPGITSLVLEHSYKKKLVLEHSYQKIKKFGA
jgi:hypothetical protein